VNSKKFELPGRHCNKAPGAQQKGRWYEGRLEVTMPDGTQPLDGTGKR